MIKCLCTYYAGGYITVDSTITIDQQDNGYITNYVAEWNKKNRGLPNTLSCSFHFVIVYHSMKDLFSGNKYNYDQNESFLINNGRDNESAYPLIHLTLFDIFDLPIDSYSIPDAKRYKKVIDSSIWNYYVPLFETETTNEGKKKLVEKLNFKKLEYALGEIKHNTFGNNANRYQLAITHEYVDINARLLLQSHLLGSHSRISPFLFHSENEMHEKIIEYEKSHNVTLETIQRYRWRFLLLDDKSIEPLSSNDRRKTNINKLQIISNNLQRILGFEENKIWFRAFDRDGNGNIVDNDGNMCEITDADDVTEKGVSRINQTKIKSIVFKDNSCKKKGPKAKVLCGRVIEGDFRHSDKYPNNPKDIQIVFDCVDTIDEAEYCLQNYRYDIILLDYLLKEEKNEYGYQLLKDLQTWCQEKNEQKKENKSVDKLDCIYKPGPNKRFFFMFISAFTTAVHERMLEQGFGRREKGLWIIGDGACPTNTPYLFSYQLLMLMRQRITDLRKENEGGYLTLIDLLMEIFVNRDKSGLVDVRERAHQHFNHILYMRNKYHHLENDFDKEDERNDLTGKDIMNMKSSLLIQSVFGYVHHFSGAMFEHLQHLVYLTAFGTIRQWTELWEEYVFIHKILTQYDVLTGKTDGKKINRAIREYIIKLKENSN